MNQKLSNFAKTAGPGILFASTAIGVSHLVQSTRGGADYGLMILGFVLVAALFKYPFFEFGSRYANSTQTSLIDGYKKIGRPALWLYGILTVGGMFFVTGAVGFVTAGFFENLFGLENMGIWSLVILFSICVCILGIGKFNVLDSLIKILVVVLLISTVTAFAFTIYVGPIPPIDEFIPKELFAVSGIFFLLALMGWMPAPLDISAWNSLWTLQRIKQTKYRPKLKETIFEFKLTYIITILLAVMFVVLGSYIFYGSGEELPNSPSLFAQKIVTMYTSSIGDWSYIVIAASAFTVMFGTILAVLDGYSRALHKTIELLFTSKQSIIQRKTRTFYTFFLLLLSVGSIIVIFQFGDNLRDLVDFATVLSFMMAPVIAIFNYRLVTGKYLKKEHQPAVWLKILSIAGIIFLLGFAIYFVIIKFFL